MEKPEFEDIRKNCQKYHLVLRSSGVAEVARRRCEAVERQPVSMASQSRRTQPQMYTDYGETG